MSSVCLDVLLVAPIQLVITGALFAGAVVDDWDADVGSIDEPDDPLHPLKMAISTTSAPIELKRFTMGLLQQQMTLLQKERRHTHTPIMEQAGKLGVYKEVVKRIVCVSRT
jgi:hypothetical protein